MNKKNIVTSESIQPKNTSENLKSYQNYMREKLEFYGGLIYFLLIIFLVWLIVITVIINIKEKDKTLLYVNNGTNNTISSSSIEKVLYTYHTRNISNVLKSYKGEFLVTYNPRGSVTFIVTDQTGQNITGNITDSKYDNVPTIVEFKSPNPTGVLTLSYKSNINFDLQRLEILIL